MFNRSGGKFSFAKILLIKVIQFSKKNTLERFPRWVFHAKLLKTFYKFIKSLLKYGFISLVKNSKFVNFKNKIWTVSFRLFRLLFCESLQNILIRMFKLLIIYNASKLPCVHSCDYIHWKPDLPIIYCCIFNTLIN